MLNIHNIHDEKPESLAKKSLMILQCVTIRNIIVFNYLSYACLDVWFCIKRSDYLPKCNRLIMIDDEAIFVIHQVMHHGCQMAIAEFLYCMCLALRA